MKDKESDFIAGQEGARKLKGLERDIEVREEGLKRLEGSGGDPDEISDFQEELSKLRQAQNMLAGPFTTTKEKKPFFV